MERLRVTKVSWDFCQYGLAVKMLTLKQSRLSLPRKRYTLCVTSTSYRRGSALPRFRNTHSST